MECRYNSILVGAFVRKVFVSGHSSSIFIHIMAPRKNKKGGRRRRRGTGLQADGAYTEVFTFSVIAGNTTQVTVGTLANRPPRSNFRPLWMQAEVASFVPADDATPATFSPVAFQMEFVAGSNAAGTGNASSTSRLILATTTPRRTRVRYPVSEDWYTFNQQDSTLVANLSAVCIGRPGSATSTVYVRGVITMRVLVQREVSGTACPAVYVDEEGTHLS